MGDPDLMPISSYESTILVRMLYQISSRINEMVGGISNLWCIHCRKKKVVSIMNLKIHNKHFQVKNVLNYLFK